jgi:hypothetical protein
LKKLTDGEFEKKTSSPHSSQGGGVWTKGRSTKANIHVEKTKYTSTSKQVVNTEGEEIVFEEFNDENDIEMEYTPNNNSK